MMIRKDYDLVASTINAYVQDAKQYSDDYDKVSFVNPYTPAELAIEMATLRQLTSNFARRFALQDEKFDAERFTTACGF